MLAMERSGARELLGLGPWSTMGLVARGMLLGVLVDARLVCEEGKALRILAVAVPGPARVPHPAL